MAGLLSAAMRSELARPGVVVAGVVTLDFESGERSYSDRPIGSDTLGNIRGDVTPGGWGRIRRAASDHNHSLTLSGTTVTIIDKDRNFARLLRDENRYRLNGTTATIRLISPNVGIGDWPVLFTGLLERWNRTGQFQWQLGLAPDDKPLMGPFLRLQILPADFPNPGDRSAYALWTPAYWGVHDSRGTTDTGSVPAHYVDRIGFRYLVAFGWVTVQRVYKDGVLVPDTDYTIAHQTINGRLYTLIVADSPGWDPENVITADITGYEDQGDGGGTLITGADVLKHQSVNFIWNDPPADGAWLPDAEAPVSAAGFAAAQTFLERQGWQQLSSGYDGTEQGSGKDAVSKFLRTGQGAIKAFFTRAGELSLAVNDHATLTLSYADPRWIRFHEHERGSRAGTLAGPEYLRDNLADRISAGYLYETAGGAFRRNIEVRELVRDVAGDVLPSRAPYSTDLPLSHASIA